MMIENNILYGSESDPDGRKEQLNYRQLNCKQPHWDVEEEKNHILCGLEYEPQITILDEYSHYPVWVQAQRGDNPVYLIMNNEMGVASLYVPCTMLNDYVSIDPTGNIEIRTKPTDRYSLHNAINIAYKEFKKFIEKLYYIIDKPIGVFLPEITYEIIGEIPIATGKQSMCSIDVGNTKHFNVTVPKNILKCVLECCFEVNTYKYYDIFKKEGNIKNIITLKCGKRSNRLHIKIPYYFKDYEKLYNYVLMFYDNPYGKVVKLYNYLLDIMKMKNRKKRILLGVIERGTQYPHYITYNYLP